MNTTKTKNLHFDSFKLADKCLFYTFKFMILSVFYFSKSGFYTLYIVFVTLGIYGNQTRTISFFFLYFVIFLCIIAIVLLFISLYQPFRNYITNLLGERFVNQYWESSSQSFF